MKKITLGNKVVVSDPCYTIPTWCQIVVNDVLPGEYLSSVEMVDLNEWGTRSNTMVAIHKDYLDAKLRFSEYPGTVGVDSGQAGIFDFDSYRNDEVAEGITTPSVDFNLGEKGEGEKWYEKMCKFTLSEKSWGVYDSGIVSSSGVGDGSYDLYVAKIDKKVVALAIDFGVAKKNLRFYKDLQYADI
jgi:hypothetical protein